MVRKGERAHRRLTRAPGGPEHRPPDRIRHADLALVSIASARKIAIKASLGRLAVPMAVEDILNEAGFVLLPVTLAHTAELAQLPHHHRDPFDRMLIAQARTERLAPSRTTECFAATTFRLCGRAHEPPRPYRQAAPLALVLIMSFILPIGS